jgi:hypothetical protein
MISEKWNRKNMEGSVMAKFKLLLWHLPGNTEGNNENGQDNSSRLRFKSASFKIL